MSVVIGVCNVTMYGTVLGKFLFRAIDAYVCKYTTYNWSPLSTDFKNRQVTNFQGTYVIIITICQTITSITWSHNREFFVL